MNVTDLLVGKTVNVKSDVGVIVPLIIKLVKIKTENHSEDLEPSTRENDWWPAQRTWTTTTVTVHFTNVIQETITVSKKLKL